MDAWDVWQIWGRLSDLLQQLVDRYDVFGIALLVLVEEAGLPLPLPSDLLVLLAGYRIGRGDMSLIPTLLLLEAATVVGGSIMYWLGARGGRPLLYRYGRLIRVGPDRLDRIAERLRRHGAWAVFLGRVIPGLRIATPLAAGAFGVPYRIFLPALALGGFVYISVFLFLGAYVGPSAIDALGEVELSVRLVATLALAIGLVGTLALLYRRASREGPTPSEDLPPPSIETVALAGLVATLGMMLVTNLLLMLLAALGALGPQAALIRFVYETARMLTGGDVPRLIAGLAIFLLASGFLWAFVYARFAVQRLPGPVWLRGALFSVLPFAASLLLLVLLLTTTAPETAGPVGVWPILGEAVRNAFFGAGLGIAYGLLREARAPRSAGAPSAPREPTRGGDGFVPSPAGRGNP